MKTNKFIYLALFMSLFLFLFPIHSMADEENLGYSVSAILNGKQIDPEKSYFYIQTTPGEEQELAVTVKSTMEEPVKIKVYVEDAFTGNKGTVEYTTDKKLLDSTLKDPMSSIVTVETPSVTVENFGATEAKFKLTPPSENYAGVKMGTLVFELDNGEEEGGVGTKFAYRIGIVTSETGEDYDTSQTLNLLDAKSTLLRGKKMILATLQNPEPKVLSKLAITAELKNKENETVMKKEQVENYALAPNSSFDFEMDWGTADIRAGTYVLTLAAKNSYNDWKFEKEFIITGEQAKSMNEQSGFKIITPTWIKVVTIGCLIFMLGITGLLLIRRKKMALEWERRRKRKKRKKKKEGK
ncbi:hypothetical protein ATZ33_15480 [Enterococcus silesiacus]|uniref:Uncharacterized protein n=1 Tax=Enterococcus silesiacus TaxID=332949 RepID=A0A0S3KEJ8_9ENTE|nr:DUF916 and DUF3324 domain-containing protein [Enterococcus silesiacus]ALS02726.1 hypothetical protein ATZ33_15480 [Enterococcus silesiacus]OJG89719.1 hypothetical protein RV15_GL001560 [Enterococcus silesiacus]